MTYFVIVLACEPHFLGAVYLWLESDVARKQFKAFFNVIPNVRFHGPAPRCDRPPGTPAVSRPRPGDGGRGSAPSIPLTGSATVRGALEALPPRDSRERSMSTYDVGRAAAEQLENVSGAGQGSSGQRRSRDVLVYPPPRGTNTSARSPSVSKVSRL